MRVAIRARSCMGPLETALHRLSQSFSNPNPHRGAVMRAPEASTRTWSRIVDVGGNGQRLRKKLLCSPVEEENEHDHPQIADGKLRAVRDGAEHRKWPR